MIQLVSFKFGKKLSKYIINDYKIMLKNSLILPLIFFFRFLVNFAYSCGNK